MKFELLAFLFVSQVMAVVAQTNSPLQLSDAASVGAVVMDAESGELVSSYDADRRLVPASLTKLFTTAAVMEQLGGDYRIPTKAIYHKSTNTLYIVGMCDPTMDSWRYPEHTTESFAEDIAKQLSSRGVKSLARLVLVDSYISGAVVPSKRLWEDMGNYYGAVPQVFNVSENVVEVVLSSPKSAGRHCEVRTPGYDCYVDSYAKKSDSVYVYCGLNGERKYVSGGMPSGREAFVVKGASYDGREAFGLLLRGGLEKRGVSVVKIDVSVDVPSDGVLVSTSLSPDVKSIVKNTNHESVNLYADALTLHLCDGNASYDQGVARLRQYVEKVTGQRAQLYDGSGLSPMNTTTARQVALLLRHVLSSRVAGDYEESLATAGVSGTLRRLGKGTPIEGKVRGKSGSMTGVMGYAGEFVAKSGRRMVFCVLVNHYEEQNADLRRRIGLWIEKSMINF